MSTPTFVDGADRCPRRDKKDCTLCGPSSPWTDLQDPGRLPTQAEWIKCCREMQTQHNELRKRQEQKQLDQSKRPHIDDSDPNNPIFRTVVANHEFSFSIKYVPREHQQKLASIIARDLHETYAYGRKEARAEIQAAIRNALML